MRDFRQAPHVAEAPEGPPLQVQHLLSSLTSEISTSPKSVTVTMTSP